jgi:hypothetical protein
MAVVRVAPVLPSQYPPLDRGRLMCRQSTCQTRNCPHCVMKNCPLGLVLPATGFSEQFAALVNRAEALSSRRLCDAEGSRRPEGARARAALLAAVRAVLGYEMRAAAFTESKQMRKPSPVAMLLTEYETRQATQPAHRRMSVAQLGSVTRLTGRPHPFANLRGAPNANRPLPRHGIATTQRRTEAAKTRPNVEMRRARNGDLDRR